VIKDQLVIKDSVVIKEFVVIMHCGCPSGAAASSGRCRRSA
jgi:hypothetical protein